VSWFLENHTLVTYRTICFQNMFSGHWNRYWNKIKKWNITVSKYSEMKTKEKHCYCCASGMWLSLSLKVLRKLDKSSAWVARMIVHKSALFWWNSQEREWQSFQEKATQERNGVTVLNFSFLIFFQSPKVLLVPNLFISTASQIRADVISIK